MKLPVPDAGISDAARLRLEALLTPPENPGPRRALPVSDPEPSSLTESPPEDVDPELPAWRAFGRRHLRVLIILLAVGVGYGAWSVARARPVEVPSEAPSAAVVSAPASAVASPRTLVVHVTGAVVHPGVVRLPDGARVHEALAAAGGLTADADPGQLNLAATVADGAQIVVGTTSAPGGEVRGAGPPGPGSTGSDAGQLDLNTATQAQLEALPGVGPVTAGKIVAWRTQHGRFTRVEELGEVDGIGPKTLTQLKPHVRV